MQNRLFPTPAIRQSVADRLPQALAGGFHNRWPFLAPADDDAPTLTRPASAAAGVELPQAALHGANAMATETFLAQYGLRPDCTPIPPMMPRNHATSPTQARFSRLA